MKDIYRELEILERKDEIRRQIENHAKEINVKKKKRKTKRAGPLRIILSIISEIVFWVVCLTVIGGAVIFTLRDDPQKSFFGYRIYNVLTHSMTPAEDGSGPSDGFRRGDLIVVQLCDPKEVQVGDIITFNPNSKDGTMYLTHRVVEVNDSGEGISFVTKGDANDTHDPEIDSSMLIGKKVFHVPFAGWPLQMIRENFVLSILIVLLPFCIILALKWAFPKKLSDPQTGTASPARKTGTTWAMHPAKRRR